MSEQRKQKEPALAAILNLLTGGVGYLYLGQTTKGMVVIACEIFLGSMAACLAFAPLGLPEMGMAYVGCCLSLTPLFFGGLIALFTAWDGYVLAQRINEGHSPGNWEFLAGRKDVASGGSAPTAGSPVAAPSTPTAAPAQARCPSCNQPVRAGAKFCDSCGASLVRACAKCGATLRPDARFCDSCGASV